MERLRESVLTETEDIEPRTVILLSITKSTELLKTILSKSEIKQHKERIQQIIKGELNGKATKEAIESMHAAIMVIAIMPAVFATTTTTS